MGKLFGDVVDVLEPHGEAQKSLKVISTIHKFVCFSCCEIISTRPMISLPTFNVFSNPL